jgi:hypothetical protein
LNGLGGNSREHDGGRPSDTPRSWLRGDATCISRAGGSAPAMAREVGGGLALCNSRSNGARRGAEKCRFGCDSENVLRRRPMSDGGFVFSATDPATIRALFGRCNAGVALYDLFPGDTHCLHSTAIPPKSCAWTGVLGTQFDDRTPVYANAVCVRRLLAAASVRTLAPWLRIL